MLRKKFLGVLTAMTFAMLGLAISLQVARADDPDREIPAIEATSPSAGTIQVTWGDTQRHGHAGIVPGVLGAVGH